MTHEILVYGADWCHDTRDTLKQLDAHGVAYTYIDVDKDPTASEWVKNQNDGKERKPTLRVGDRVVSVPTADELDTVLREQGFSVGA